MTTVAIIPARMQSTRFPGKPLALILGLPMIEHVRRRVSLCKELKDVIVATCDEEIKKVVEEAGGKAVMTSDKHDRCTDRIAEAASNLKADIVVNVQGDECLVVPEMIEASFKPLLDEPDLQCVNMVTPIVDQKEFEDPNAPKVVTDLKGNILYISREPIPSQQKTDDNQYRKLKQLGLIAFRHDFLQTFINLEETPLEKVESVDMMRPIEHGYTVRAVETTHQMIAVDVPGDIKRVEEVMSNDPLLEEYIQKI